MSPPLALMHSLYDPNPVRGRDSPHLTNTPKTGYFAVGVLLQKMKIEEACPDHESFHKAEPST